MPYSPALAYKQLVKPEPEPTFTETVVEILHEKYNRIKSSPKGMIAFTTLNLISSVIPGVSFVVDDAAIAKLVQKHFAPEFELIPSNKGKLAKHIDGFKPEKLSAFLKELRREVIAERRMLPLRQRISLTMKSGLAMAKTTSLYPVWRTRHLLQRALGKQPPLNAVEANKFRELGQQRAFNPTGRVIPSENFLKKLRDNKINVPINVPKPSRFALFKERFKRR